MKKKKIMQQLKPFKVPLILVGVFIVFYIGITFIYPTVNDILANRTPIVSITAKNNIVYKQGKKIQSKDFVVKAKHKNGMHSTLSPKDYTVTPDHPSLTGKMTEVTLKTKENHTYKMKVKNDRKKIFSADCGNPKRSSVKAVVYSNGELSFEGDGDVLQFKDNEFPWRMNDEIEIKAVTFENTITPTSLDGWFKDMDSLISIGTLPPSVESISNMCEGCDSLVTAADWSQCEKLIDAKEAYKDCIKLKNVPDLIPSLRNMTKTFEGCYELQDTPDMTNATSLRVAEDMYRDCKSLTTTSALPALKNMNGMYADCINLKEMPDIPDGVLSMNSAFLNNISMKKVKVIPATVTDVSSCFKGCEKLEGTLIVNANAEDYSGFLSDSCHATFLDLQGSSSILNKLALTNVGNNITINGSQPVKD